MLNPFFDRAPAPDGKYNLLETINFKLYEALPRFLPYMPNPIFLTHIGREYHNIAWHSDFRVFFPHSLQYRMLRAITTGDFPEINLLLKDPRFKIDQQIDKKYGLNSLQFASMVNQYPVIQLLLLYGANINKKDQYGNTSLMYAVDRHNLQSINSLMKNGSNRYQKNNYGIDSIQKAKTKFNQSYLVEFLANYPETPRRYPKFKVKIDFEDKVNNKFWNYVKNYKIYDSKPKLFPFNNFKGTYRIDFTPFQTVEEILFKNLQQLKANPKKNQPNNSK